MRAGLAESLDAGAWGMSTGLVYPPGSYATTDEIVAVGEALRGRTRCTPRTSATSPTSWARPSTRRIDIGRPLGVRVEISHLKSAGRQNHGKSGGRSADRRGARRRRRVAFDVYPYTAGSTMLTQLLPPWLQDGGIEALIERLRSPRSAPGCATRSSTGCRGFANFSARGGGWHGIMIAAVREPVASRWAEGRTVAELAAERDLRAARVRDGPPGRGSARR